MDPVGRVDRREHHGRGAERVADEHHRVEAERVEQRDDVGRDRGVGVVGPVGRRLAHAPQVDGDDAVAGGDEARGEVAVHLATVAEPGQRHDGGPGGTGTDRRGVVVGEAVAVAVEEAGRRGGAGSGVGGHGHQSIAETVSARDPAPGAVVGSRSAR